ncbi:YhcN/YlaJ family sporulation lipoprotein [Sporosarcina luteola]|uniref:YhcN/YlaJ family sporulation lipoprotein n=1 Tax=Sporosarcina luteola TaxID=582850 RepID=UPI0020412936|nr:YhcN/YlaJ family sporulation lipoprotein [Sporosarcina luteola]MCM3742955.1 YhcN/YlaJ family sporulation lipoprotein [Sporosarcina luteola]
MKKRIIFPISLLLILALVGCANRGANNTNGNAVNDNNRATENTGVGESAHGTNDLTNDQNNMNGHNGTNTAGNTERKVEVADDAADKIASMKEVERANVLVTDRNAYVGVELKKDVKESEQLKKKIADEVRRVHSEFNNVYVSFNPDVATRFTEYGNQIRAGEPVEGFYEEFTTGIHRMFPEAK